MINYFNLQMFAEETPTEPAVETPAEPKEEKPAEKTYTQAELDEYVNRIVKGKKAEWDKSQQKEQQKKAEEEKVAKMDSDQKHQYELEQKDKRIAELEKAAAKVELSKTATSILRESDIDATDDILNFVVGDDEDATKENIDKLVKIIETQIKKAEKARATGKTPKSYTNDGKEMSEIDKRIAKYK